MGYKKVGWLRQTYYVFRWKILRWLDSLESKHR